ncbi:MAG: arginine N-succinyltransferase, partial [Alphaproteobacteria bacterium]|nr:arginine N-succinyltransferase [Alphaproteobacteria bacterium]
MFIRTAAMEDHAAVLELANKAGFGMTSLPPDPAVLEAKIAHSIASFKGEVEAGHEAYFFVLEDPVKHTIAGTCGIVAHVGLT